MLKKILATLSIAAAMSIASGQSAIASGCPAGSRLVAQPVSTDRLCQGMNNTESFVYEIELSTAKGGIKKLQVFALTQDDSESVLVGLKLHGPSYPQGSDMFPAELHLNSIGEPVINSFGNGSELWAAVVKESTFRDRLKILMLFFSLNAA
jgi:hypothetical protein